MYYNFQFLFSHSAGFHLKAWFVNMHFLERGFDIYKGVGVRFADFVCLFDLILNVPSTIFQLNRDGSSWVEPVLSYDKCVLLKDHNAVTPLC